MDPQPLSHLPSVIPHDESRGGYSCEFVEPPPVSNVVQTECPVCLQILRRPCLISCKCGQKYCEECIELLSKDNKPCPLCNKPNFNFIRDYALERYLLDLDVWCSYKELGCEWSGKLREFEVHLNQRLSHHCDSSVIECQYIAVECNQKCGDWYQRRHVTVHQTDQCKKRPYTCDYCKDYDSTFEDVTETHYPQCNKYPVECPNKCREYPFERQELESHLKDECPLTLVDCQFQFAGCGIKVPRKDMPEHMKEDTATHLTLLASITQNLMKENLKLRVKVHTTVTKTQSLQEKLKELNTTLIRYSGFPKVYSVKSSVNGTYLPAFYSHPQGYTMCLNVVPNGSGDGKGTHVSIYIYLAKSSRDKNLKWPFKGNITIQIVNQAGDHDHVEKIIAYDDLTPSCYAGRVTSREWSEGWGDSQFIAHGELKDNVARKIQYLKDDHLKICIVKVDLL